MIHPRLRNIRSGFIRILIPIVAIYLFLGFQTMAAFAQSPIAKLSGPIQSGQLRGHVDYYLDKNREQTVSDMLGPNASLFEPVTTLVPDFGYTKSIVWLRMAVKNPAVSDTAWQLYFHENFMQIFEVYVARENGIVDNPLKQNPSSNFSTRPVPFPELVAPINLKANETATILVRYWSGGSSSLAFSMETPSSFAEISATRSAKNYIYYGMTVLLIIVSLLAMVIFKHVVFPAYAAYATSTLLFLMHADGVAFQYLWPAFPGFNGFASLVTGSGVILFGANYARVFLQTSKHHPILDSLLIMVIGLTIVMDFSTLFADLQLLKKLFVLLAFVAITLFTASGLVAARTRFKQVRFYVFAWAGAFLSVLLMTLRHWLGIEVSQDFQLDSMRVVMVFDATMMGLAIADRYNQLRNSSHKAMQLSLDTAERNLELSNRLYALEEKYSLAAELGQTRDEAIQNTIHDLRQPIHALRLNLKNMFDGAQESESARTNIESTFGYLEDLVSGHLENSGNPSQPLGANNNQKDSSEIGVEEVLRSIYEMFSPDAEKKGLTFNYVPTSHNAVVDPLILMRIISNLVSNAIKYTQSGKILLGTRLRKNHLLIEVHDTGSGMTEADFEIAKERTARLDHNKAEATGNGYGLSIAAQLASKNGLSLWLKPNRRSGTSIVLEVPIDQSDRI